MTVADVTLAELKRHPVSFGRAGFEGELVPALEELIALLAAGTGLALELKTDRFLEPEVARRLGETLRSYGLLDRTAVLSFRFERCRVVKREVPEILAGFLSRMGSLPPEGEAQMVGPLWPVLFANPFFVSRARRRGLFVAPLDERPDGRLWYYRLLGCDAVLTNDPAATLRKLGRSPPVGRRLTGRARGDVRGRKGAPRAIRPFPGRGAPSRPPSRRGSPRPRARRPARRAGRPRPRREERTPGRRSSTRTGRLSRGPPREIPSKGNSGRPRAGPTKVRLTTVASSRARAAAVSRASSSSFPLRSLSASFSFPSRSSTAATSPSSGAPRSFRRAALRSS